MDELKKVLCEVFRLKEDEYNEALTMDDIEKWDSLTHMDLITSIEEKFDIQLTMDEIMKMKNFKTINSIVSEKKG